MASKTVTDDQYLAAMRAEAIPIAESGLWFVAKVEWENPCPIERQGQTVLLPAGSYTYLRVYTDSTLLRGGEVVMEDTPFELQTHLDFVRSAFGRVLVTGLGLGCVLRGLQHNPAVTEIVCIENSPDVLRLVSPHMPTDKLTIIEADALMWTAANTDAFDCAWHDLWTNRDNGEPHLDVWHTKLLVNCQKTVKRQGAWAYAETLKRKLHAIRFPWMG